MKRKFCIKLLFSLSMLLSGLAHAALTIEITQGIDGAVPIAVVPFDISNNPYQPQQDVSGIIAADLARSGRFAPVDERDMLSKPSDIKQVRFQDWRTLGVDNLVIGKVEAAGADKYRIQFRVFDVYRGRQITGHSMLATAAQLRYVAHRISDIIYEKLTGEPGAFATHIAYVEVEKKADYKEYRLLLADSDGFNAKTLLTSRDPLMSPAWSPDGRQLAYVSFEKRRASIYVQDAATGKRHAVAKFAGINGAPAWSPDGSKLALTLSRDGNPEIYSLRLKDSQLKRLTVGPAIDTEPVWSPDGSSIVFTSDRGGSPQLYRMSASGGSAKRLTFEGSYNASADFSPDGRNLTMVNGDRGHYRIAVQDLDSGLFRVISDGKLDESPSFAPNGSMIIYATEAGRRGVLAAVSSDGRFRQQFSVQKGEVREPVWSPYSKQR
jgi:TolB protein